MLIEEAIKRLELMLVASVDNFNDSIATGFNADSPISPDEDETETFRSFFEKDFEAYRTAITALKTQLSQEATTKGTTWDLISRQAAIDLLIDYANTVSLDENLNVNAKTAIQVGITNCIGIVNHDIPSVQPEIIHCGECQFREIYGVDGFCDHITGEPIMVKKTDHCSWAERRTDATD